MLEQEGFWTGEGYWMPSGRSFSFDPKNKEFIVGDERIEISGISDIFDLNKPSIYDDVAMTGSETLVMGPLLVLIECFKLREWLVNLEEERQKRIFKVVEETMAKIFRPMDPSAEIPEKRSPAFWLNFSAMYNKNGRFHLQTLGNCACLGVDPTSIWTDYTDYEESNLHLPLAYNLHNADTAKQRLSLYAGAGTLAWIANQEIR